MQTLHKSAVNIPAASAVLPGDLSVPVGAKGLVIFAHGSGSSRFSGRNRFVAERLGAGGFATLLFDLLTPTEDSNYLNRFDIELLTDRLAAVVGWVQKQGDTRSLPIGLFGASTGAAAALKVAVRLGSHSVAAVVSRGGRPDLAVPDIATLQSPTLLIVGGADPEVLQLNHEAYDAIPAGTAKSLEIVSGATHLFEEPGTLEKVADLANAWFAEHLIQAP